MIREIEKPEIDFKFYIHEKLKFYYDEENGEYFIETKSRTKYYFNLEGEFHRIGKPAIWNDVEEIWKENGKIHRLGGPAHSSRYYYINNKHYIEKEFAKETKHLICGKCGKFCKQRCFI